MLTPEQELVGRAIREMLDEMAKNSVAPSCVIMRRPKGPWNRKARKRIKMAFRAGKLPAC